MPSELGLRRSVTGCQMRAHFTVCAKRPAGCDHVDPRRRNSKVRRGPPTAAANAVRLGLRSATHSEPDACAFHRLPQAAESLKVASASRPMAKEREPDRYRVRVEVRSEGGILPSGTPIRSLVRCRKLLCSDTCPETHLSHRQVCCSAPFENHLVRSAGGLVFAASCPSSGHHFPA
jgi:hypothetical protein